MAKLDNYSEIGKIGIGDTVHIYDNDGHTYVERVIKLTEYPFEPKETRSENELLQIVGDLLTIFNSSGRPRLELGNVGGQFALNIYDSSGRRLKIKLGDYGDTYAFAIYDDDGSPGIYMDETGEVVFAGSVDTNKDVRVGRRVDIAVNDISSEDYSGVRFLDSNGKPIGQICCREDGTLWFIAQDFMVDGAHIATDVHIQELSDRIDETERQIAMVNGRIDRLEQGGEG